jgi:hypothetical protein
MVSIKMSTLINYSDVIGLAKTDVDVHTLGITCIDDLLRNCGFATAIVDDKLSKAFLDPRKINNASLIEKWIYQERISVLGFSYRLDPSDSINIFRELIGLLKDRNLLVSGGGPIKSVYFAGLPDACDFVRKNFENVAGVFYGDETPQQSLTILGIDPSLAPLSIMKQHHYDKSLEDFCKDIIDKGEYTCVGPVDRSYPFFGTRKDGLIARLNDGKRRGLPPIIRAHAGPYHQKREEAIKQFIDWSKQLASAGLLDVLSIGTSQLTQSRFGETWEGYPNGGGVPINSSDEFRRIYEAALPMLVRTYAGTKDLTKLAKIYERDINIAWHALSLWWFSQIDGRGTNPVLDNLREHFDTIRYIASTKKPFEANVPHHFAFRGADDISYIVSAVLSARVAKKLGINDFILQIMLNDPKYTWGVNDLAKSRVTLDLVKELENSNFRVYLQTRAGLDYLSHDERRAKQQLAAVAALMDDIDPFNRQSPDIIHVVSYSEGVNLATPNIINDSIRITRHALDSYRQLRNRGEIDNMSTDRDVMERKEYLLSGARLVLSTIDRRIKNPYTPEGLYDIFSAGFLPVPQLSYCRNDFPEAIRWKTKIRNGCVDIYDGENIILPEKRMEYILSMK